DGRCGDSLLGSIRSPPILLLLNIIKLGIIELVLIRLTTLSKSRENILIVINIGFILKCLQNFTETWVHIRLEPGEGVGDILLILICPFDLHLRWEEFTGDIHKF